MSWLVDTEFIYFAVFFEIWVFMELGVVYGCFWKLGPVLWGLIGLGFGVVLGFLLDYYVGKLKTA